MIAPAERPPAAQEGPPPSKKTERAERFHAPPSDPLLL